MAASRRERRPVAAPPPSPACPGASDRQRAICRRVPRARRLLSARKPSGVHTELAEGNRCAGRRGDVVRWQLPDGKDTQAESRGDRTGQANEAVPTIAGRRLSVRPLLLPPDRIVRRTSSRSEFSHRLLCALRRPLRDAGCRVIAFPQEYDIRMPQVVRVADSTRRHQARRRRPAPPAPAFQRLER